MSLHAWSTSTPVTKFLLEFLGAIGNWRDWETAEED